MPERQKGKALSKESVPTDPKSIIKVSSYFLLLTLGVFVAWAAFAPLKQGAPAAGLVVHATYRKVVQHQYGGTVKEILVHEGDEVKKGQVLIKLEDSEIRARYTNVKAEYISALIVYARLKAEKAFSPSITYPDEVKAFWNSPEIKKVILAQEELFRTRRERHEAEKRIIRETIAGLKDYISGLSRQEASYERELSIINDQIASLAPLSEEGYFPKNRYLELKRSAEDLRAKISEVSASRLRASAQIQEYLMREKAIEKEYQREIDSELADVEKKLIALKDTYNSVKDMLEKTEIKSPEDGMVMGLKIHTVGGVIPPASPIMEIAPKNSDLVVEAKLSPAHIEEVKKGTGVDLHFTALDPKRTPVLEGEVTYVSPDVMVDDATKHLYYLLRIKVKEESLEKIRKMNKEITAGMPVQVVVRTGSRTFLSYLFKPFFDRLAISFLR